VKKSPIKQFISFIVIVVLAYFGVDLYQNEPTGNHAELATAVKEGRSGFMTTVSATVVKILNDDLEGDQHQRFIIALNDDHTVLVAHNIDLAPRVPVQQGDTVKIKGQFESNDRGGVLHWTHHDPNGRHEEGWIEHQGEIYQ